MKTFCTALLTLALLGAACRSKTPEGEPKEQETGKKPKFTVSKETTYVTRPLDKDGYIDYVTALNERLSKGVTPANNANVLLWRALGPRPGGVTMPPEYFKWLGVPQPPDKGDYFLPLRYFIKDGLRLDSGKATDVITQHEATKRPWAATEYPALDSWLIANEKPLAVVLQATKRSHYFNPLVPKRTKKEPSGLIDALLPAVQASRELATGFVARAMLRLGRGDTDGAWQDLLACHRLGRLVGRGGTLVEGLVGIAIDAIASRADLVWLDRAKPEAKRLEKCLEDLRKLPPLASSASKEDLGERFMALDTVLRHARYGARYFAHVVNSSEKDIDPFWKEILHNVQWDPALRIVNEWFDRSVAILRVKDDVDRAKQLQQFEKEVNELKAKNTEEADRLYLLPVGKATPAVRGTFLGGRIAGLMMPALRKVQQAEDRAGQVQDNLAVAFALAWYQRDHGRYPERLEALAPKYLAKVPSDRFSGKALIYRPAEKGYLLYSVGVNGKDEGGRSFGDMPPGDDLPVRMPQPEPRK
jgi:hypothetical protein